MANVAGSIRRISLNGISFDVMGDADFSKVPTTVNDAIATTGGVVHTIVKQASKVTGVVLDGSDGIANQQIHDLHDTITPFPISYTKANGDVVSGAGRINITSDTTAEGRIEIEINFSRAADLIPA